MDEFEEWWDTVGEGMVEYYTDKADWDGMDRECAKSLAKLAWDASRRVDQYG